MIRVVRAEWRKLRRPTLFLGTIGAALFFTGLFTSLLFLLIDSPRGNSDPANPISREMLSSFGGSVIGFTNVGGLARHHRLLCLCGTDCTGVHIRNFAQSLSSPTWPFTPSRWKTDLDETICSCHGFDFRRCFNSDRLLPCSRSKG